MAKKRMDAGRPGSSRAANGVTNPHDFRMRVSAG
jgi:hypothetical protein